MKSFEVLLRDESEFMNAPVSATRTHARLSNDVRVVRAERYDVKYENGYFVGTFYVSDEPVLTLFRCPEMIRVLEPA